MGQDIWGLLDEYAGLWVAVDKRGAVVDQAAELPELKRRAGERAPALTFLFADGPERR